MCSVRNDSKKGCSSEGVPESAAAIKSSRTSLGGLGASTAISAMVVVVTVVVGRDASRLSLFGTGAGRIGHSTPPRGCHFSHLDLY